MANSKILYVTSFSEPLYQCSGKRLLKSYLEHNIQEPMLVCYEGFEFVSPDTDRILTYALDDSIFLRHWLEKNKQIIPTKFGGLATKESNPIVFSHFMRERASLFFRKIASLQKALELYGDKYETFVWLDCDCYFINHVGLDFLRTLFQSHGVIYHQGRWRNRNNAGFEVGILGLQKNFGGYQYLEKVIDCYQTGQFLNYEKWDDGYIFRQILDQSRPEEYYGLDLCPNYHDLSVIAVGPFRNLIKHDKGIHKTIKGREIK